MAIVMMITGMAQLSIATASPVIITVATPVLLDSAIFTTGDPAV